MQSPRPLRWTRRPCPHLAALAVTITLAFVPRSVGAELRPLVREMLDNLSAVDRIGEGVALEDYTQIEKAARDLMARAEVMRGHDIATFGLDVRRDPEWDAYLLGQSRAASAILAAAQARDPRAALNGVRSLTGNACLACHASFRDPGSMLRPSVLFMTSFLSAWQDMNRGLTVRDFSLIGMRAREIEALTKVLASDQILEEAFNLGGTKQRRIFRGFLRAVTDNATLIDAASREENLAGILDSSQSMWIDGCISCHEEFRR